jgi:REP element-mobilizing transposase RayT
MANTYTSLYYHIVFSTKRREPWIHQHIEDRIWRFIGGIARKHRMRALQVGGVEDHIHAVINAPPIFAPCEIAKVLKGESSHWIHNEQSDPAFKRRPKIKASVRDAKVLIRNAGLKFASCLAAKEPPHPSTQLSPTSCASGASGVAGA